MLFARVYLESRDGFVADGVVRKHTSDGFGHREFGSFSHDLLVLYGFETADVAAVMIVILLSRFFARKDRFARVDDDNEIAAVYVGREFGFVLAAEYGSRFDGRSSERNACSVYNIPFAVNISFFAM